jgi:hypothetical protein
LVAELQRLVSTAATINTTTIVVIIVFSMLDSGYDSSNEFAYVRSNAAEFDHRVSRPCGPAG